MQGFSLDFVWSFFQSIEIMAQTMLAILPKSQYIKKGTKIFVHLSQADILILNIKKPTLNHILI